MYSKFSGDAAAWTENAAARKQRAHSNPRGTGPNGNCKEDDDQSDGQEDRTSHEEGGEDDCLFEAGCQACASAAETPNGALKWAVLGAVEVETTPLGR